MALKKHIKLTINIISMYFGFALISINKYVLHCKSLAYSYLYKKKFKTFGVNSYLNGISFFSGFNEIEIGNNVHIGNNGFIRGEGGLIIKDNTHISRNILIYTYSHEYEGSLLPYDNLSRNRPVFIGKNVWIGMNVVILPGTYIEDGVIIGAGSVVNGRVPKGSIYGAAIASEIKKRDMERYNKLDANSMYGGINGMSLKRDEG